MKKKVKLTKPIVMGILVTILLLIALIVTICSYPLESNIKYGIIPICLIYLAFFIMIVDYLKKAIVYASRSNEKKEIVLENIVVNKMIKNERHLYEYSEEKMKRLKFNPKARMRYKIFGSYCDPKDGTCHMFSQEMYDTIDLELDKYVKENNITSIPLELITSTDFEEYVDIRKLTENSLKYATRDMTDKQIFKKVFGNYSPKMFREFVVMLTAGALMLILEKGEYNWTFLFTGWLILLGLLECGYLIMTYIQYKRIKKIHSEIL